MGKKLWFLVPLAVIGLTFPSFTPSGFTLLVVDEQTGLGVPSLRVIDGNGMVRRTGSHGELIIWHRTPSTSSGDHFEIQDDHKRFSDLDATLNVKPGRRTTLRLHRRS